MRILWKETPARRFSCPFLIRGVLIALYVISKKAVINYEKDNSRLARQKCVPLERPVRTRYAFSFCKKKS
jgi:hypothetical protein